jgi:hypothetical protein
MSLGDLLAEPLLTLDEGIILGLGIFIGLVLGSLVTFMISHGMHKDPDDDSR